MNHNIFLIGFMGSGKSHWGHIWALEHGYTFYDLDTEIEKAFEMRVEEIFEKHGEDKFRELERYHLRKFDKKKKYLLSCGGGTPCFFDNLEWMKQHGEIIYLKASPEYILDRVMDETTKRPLLKEVNPAELLFFIQKKLKEREPVYLKANHILEVEKLQNDSLNFLKENNKKTELTKPAEVDTQHSKEKEKLKNNQTEKDNKSSFTEKKSKKESK
jgi:shikimate kinase